MLELLDELYQEIVVAIALGTGAGVLSYFRGINNKQKENKKAIEELCKRTWRLERAFVLSLKLNAKLTKQAHAQEQDIIDDVEEIENMVNLILKDNEE